jgi:hypothetical protein
VFAATIAAIGAAGIARWASAADHRDSMALTSDPAADIADVYTFRSPTNPSNLVLVMTVSGLIPPSEAAAASFDRDVLYQFRIDNTGDAVEDLVIQAFPTGSGDNQVMRFRGPDAPVTTGTRNTVVRSAETAQVRVSRGATPVTASNGGITVFAGVRDDPFFFDLTQFQAILAGQASGFRNPGVDTFAGTNVLAIVVEVPISMLGGSSLNVWGTTSRPVS